MSTLNTYASFTEVRRLLTALDISMANQVFRDDDMSQSDVEDFMKKADQYIDAYISAVYVLPIRQIKDKFGETAWPYPLPFISARLTAEDVTVNYFQEKDDVGVVANAHVVGDHARTMLQNIITDVIRLPGQELLARSRFYNPHIAPQPMPGQSLAQPPNGLI